MRDLSRHELVPRGQLDHQPPALSWDYLDARPGDLALITCDRGHVSRMVSRIHRVAADGRVSPSYVCPGDGCTFHEFIRLVGYEQPLSACMWICDACWLAGCEELPIGRILGSHECGVCGRTVALTDVMHYTRRTSWEERRAKVRTD